MAVRSVQFVTADAVLHAYQSREVADFTIWHDKQYLFKYDGGDLEAGAEYLQQLLQMLGNSAAIYTLKVYEEGHDKINDKTPHDGSFNFRFLEAPIYSTPGTPVMNGNRNQQEKIEQLEQKILELQQELQEGERNEDPGVMGMIDQVLSHPAIMPMIPMLVNKIFNSPGQQQPQQQQQQHQPGQLGQLSRVSGIDASGKKRIDLALQVLDKHVEDLPAIIEKLAWLAENRNSHFTMALNMLQGMR